MQTNQNSRNWVQAARGARFRLWIVLTVAAGLVLFSIISQGSRHVGSSSLPESGSLILFGSGLVLVGRAFSSVRPKLKAPSVAYSASESTSGID